MAMRSGGALFPFAGGRGRGEGGKKEEKASSEKGGRTTRPASPSCSIGVFNRGKEPDSA